MDLQVTYERRYRDILIPCAKNLIADELARVLESEFSSEGQSVIEVPVGDLISVDSPMPLLCRHSMLTIFSSAAISRICICQGTADGL